MIYVDRRDTIRQFLYDGAQLAAEYQGSGGLLRRYMFAGEDEPILVGHVTLIWTTTSLQRLTRLGLMQDGHNDDNIRDRIQFQPIIGALLQ
jgi:hypothetical protein